jgi:hypothetical protein
LSGAVLGWENFWLFDPKGKSKILALSESHGSSRTPRNTRRIRFLNAIFEDASFVRIIGEPQATINSFIVRGFLDEPKSVGDK